MTKRLRIRTSLGITAFTVLGGMLQMAATAVVAYRYGSGVHTDAFFAAYLIPSTYAMLWVACCSTGLVPLFTNKPEVAENAGHDVTSSAIVLSVLLTLSLSIAAYIIAPLLVRLLVPGFVQEQRWETVRLFRELAPLFFLVGFTGVAAAMLNARHRFLLAASNKFVVNAVVVAGLLSFASHTSITWLARLILIGALGYAGALFVHLLRLGLLDHFRFVFNRNEYALLVPALVLPFVATIIRQAGTVAERMIGSFLPAGSISSLTYSYQLIFGIATVLAVGVSTSLMPLLAGEEAAKRKSELIWQGFYYTFVMLLPFGVGAYLLANSLVALLFQHGAFSVASAVMTARVVQACAFGAVFSQLAGFFQIAFWADRQYRTLLLQNTYVTVLNVAVDLVLAPRLGAEGLAIGFTVSSAAAMMRMYWLLRRHYGDLLTRERWSRLAKPVVASAVMGLAVAGAAALLRSMEWPFSTAYANLVRFLVPVAVGLLMYLTSGLVTGMEPLPTVYRGLSGSAIRLQALLRREHSA